MCEIKRRRKLDIGKVELPETEYDKRVKLNAEFFKEMIEANKKVANNEVNNSVFIGQMLKSVEQYKDMKNLNDKTIEENEYKTMLKLKEEQKIESARNEVRRRIETGEFKIKDIKQYSIYSKQDTQMGIGIFKNVTNAEDIDLVSSICLNILNERDLAPQRDHLFDTLNIKNNTIAKSGLGCLDLFLNACKSTNADDMIVELQGYFNSKMNLVTATAKDNRSRTKGKSLPNNILYGYGDTNRVDIMQRNIDKEYDIAIDNLYNYLNDEKNKNDIERSILYKSEETMTINEMLKQSFLKTIITAMLNNVCNVFTDYVEKSLLQYTIYGEDNSFNITKMLNQFKLEDIKDESLKLYESIKNYLNLPSLSDIFNTFKSSIKNVFTNIFNGIKGTVNNVKKLFKDFVNISKHDMQKRIVSIFATALLGLFSYSLSISIKFATIIENAIRLLVSTISKMILTVVYTIIDLNDKYGEVMNKYNTFIIE